MTKVQINSSFQAQRVVPLRQKTDLLCRDITSNYVLLPAAYTVGSLLSSMFINQLPDVKKKITSRRYANNSAIFFSSDSAFISEMC